MDFQWTPHGLSIDSMSPLFNYKIIIIIIIIIEKVVMAGVELRTSQLQ